MAKEKEVIRNQNILNLTLQGKGGVGKTFVSYILAQYYMSRNLTVNCLDTDSVNHSLSKFKALNPAIIELIIDGELKQEILEDILLTVNDTQNNVIIDVGSTGFVPIINFFEENNTFSAFNENKRIDIHTIVQDKEEQETLAGVKTIYNLTKNIPNVNIIIWRNDEGVSRSEKFNLEELLKPFSDKIKPHQIIHITSRKEVFARTIKRMTKDGYTIKDVLNDSNYNVFDKQRVQTFFNDIFIQLDDLYKQEI